MTELRLALAMRGGVSLAVWMGGACAEIDALRRGRPARPVVVDDPCSDSIASTLLVEEGPLDRSARHYWGQLVALAGFEGVRIDVLSGTSAGGLNGVLLATSVKFGLCFDAYRDIWLDVGDLDKLLRKTSERQPDSLLDGDYFLEQLTEKLQQRLGAHRPNGEFVDLTLTSTIAGALGVPTVDHLGAPALEPSHRATFRFRSTGATSDFSGDGNDEQQTKLNCGLAAKLALAGRSSASFPGAFQPSTVNVARPTQDGERPGQIGQRSTPEEGAANMFGQFSDASRPTYRLVDGGVLDNIPMTLAIRAVAASPADTVTERYLLYLDPNPPSLTSANDSVEHDLLGTLKSTSGARGTAESVIDDLAELHRHNDLAFRYRTVQRTIVTGLQLPADEAALARANQQRATMAARRIRSLLEDPVATLSEDPFTGHQQIRPLLRSPGGPDRKPEPTKRTTDASTTDRVDHWVPLLTPDQLTDLEEAIDTCLREGLPRSIKRVDPPGVAEALGPEAAVNLSLALLELVHYAEQQGHGSLVCTHKPRLYAIYDVAALLTHCLELFWPVHAAENPPDPARSQWADGWAMHAIAERGLLLDALTGLQQQDGALLPEKWAPFTVLHHELWRCRKLAGVHDDSQPLLRHLWNLLHNIAEDLAPVAANLSRGVQVSGKQADIMPPIIDAMGRSSPDVAQRLLSYEVLTQQLQSISPRPPLPMKFVRVSSAQSSPANDRWFGGRLTPTTKLTGNEVSNFAAFYKSSWRANDWMWGRLDAAATLVNLLITPNSLKGLLERQSGAPARDDCDAVLRQLKNAVVDVHRDSPLAAGRGYGSYLEERWKEASRDIWEELKALRAGEACQLSATRRLLTERRQLEILCAEIPAVFDAATSDQLGVVNRALNEAARHESLLGVAGRRSITAVDLVGSPERLLEFCKRSYRVGAESLGDEVGRPRFTDLMSQLLVVAWRAMTRSPNLPAILKPLGVVLFALRAAAVGVVRFPAWAVLLTPIAAIAAGWVVLGGEDAIGPLDRAGAIAVLVALGLVWFGPVLKRPAARSLGALLALGAAVAIIAVAWQRQAWFAYPFRWAAEGLLVRPVILLGLLVGLCAAAAVAAIVAVVAKRRSWVAPFFGVLAAAAVVFTALIMNAALRIPTLAAAVEQGCTSTAIDSDALMEAGVRIPCGMAGFLERVADPAVTGAVLAVVVGGVAALALFGIAWWLHALTYGLVMAVVVPAGVVYGFAQQSWWLLAPAIAAAAVPVVLTARDALRAQREEETREAMLGASAPSQPPNDKSRPKWGISPPRRQ